MSNLKMCVFDFFTTTNIFFELYAFIILTSTLVLCINYFVIVTRPLHPIPVRKRRRSSCYMIETYNSHHRFPCYRTMNSHIMNGVCDAVMRIENLYSIWWIYDKWGLD